MILGLYGIDAIAWSVSNVMTICLTITQVFIATGAFKELKTELEPKEDEQNQELKL